MEKQENKNTKNQNTLHTEINKKQLSCLILGLKINVSLTS